MAPRAATSLGPTTTRGAARKTEYVYACECRIVSALLMCAPAPQKHVTRRHWKRRGGGGGGGVFTTLLGCLHPGLITATHQIYLNTILEKSL